MNTKTKQKSGIARLLEISGRRKGLLFVSGTAAVLHAVLSMVPYILIFYIMKELLSGQVNSPDINTYLTWAFIAVAFSFVLMYASAMASHIAAFNILYELRKKIAGKIGKLPMGYIGNRSSGALKKILADDVERIEVFIAHGVPDFIKGMALPIIFLSYLFVADWRLALISFVPLILVGVLVTVYFGSAKNKQIMEKYHTSLEDMNAGIVEFVRAMPVMKIFGQTATAFTKYSGTVNMYDKFINLWTRKQSPVWAVFMSFINNALLPVLALGLYLYFQNGLSLPVLFLFLILGVGYIRPVLALSNLDPQISMINHGVKRMDEILFEVEEQKSGSKQTPEDFSLTFNNVGFSYIEGIEVLKDVSFTIPARGLTALVGASGSGKTTIANLIARFWDVQKGKVTIGDEDVKDMSPQTVYSLISEVFQDVYLFDDTIYNNIKIGKPDATSEEIMKVAEKAQVTEFLNILSDGINTKVGEAGSHLSGGQKQRVSIARAMLKNAPIVLLDEATASLDPENEIYIQQAIQELVKEKTVVVIAHKLQTIRNADKLIVLENGHITEEGKHAELLKNNGLYARYWNTQQTTRGWKLKQHFVYETR